VDVKVGMYVKDMNVWNENGGGYKKRKAAIWPNISLVLVDCLCL
jgi:hypothetical protein